MDITNEDIEFQNEVENIKKFFKKSRFNNIQRNYTAEQVAVLRGNFKIEYPSNQMSKKFWNLFFIKTLFIFQFF